MKKIVNTEDTTVSITDNTSVQKELTTEQLVDREALNAIYETMKKSESQFILNRIKLGLLLVSLRVKHKELFWDVIDTRKVSRKTLERAMIFVLRIDVNFSKAMSNNGGGKDIAKTVKSLKVDERVKDLDMQAVSKIYEPTLVKIGKMKYLSDEDWAIVINGSDVPFKNHIKAEVKKTALKKVETEKVEAKKILADKPDTMTTDTYIRYTQEDKLFSITKIAELEKDLEFFKNILSKNNLLPKVDSELAEIKTKSRREVVMYDNLLFKELYTHEEAMEKASLSKEELDYLLKKDIIYSSKIGTQTLFIENNSLNNYIENKERYYISNQKQKDILKPYNLAYTDINGINKELIYDDAPVINPIGYPGNKYDLLTNIIPLIKNNIDTFYDIYGGSFNIEAEKIIYNDIDYHLVNLIKHLAEGTVKTNYEAVVSVMNTYNLFIDNNNGFLKLREDYNKLIHKEWAMYYVLVILSVKNIGRKNKKDKYNNSYNHKTFSDSFKAKFILFTHKLIEMADKFDYKQLDALEILRDTEFKINDFIYFDPVYIITNHKYGVIWNEHTEMVFLHELDKLNDRGISFALSNVFEHMGKTNDMLKKWSKKYYVHYLNKKYSMGRKGKGNTVEVLITNYPTINQVQDSADIVQGSLVDNAQRFLAA